MLCNCSRRDLRQQASANDASSLHDETRALVTMHCTIDVVARPHSICALVVRNALLCGTVRYGTVLYLEAVFFIISWRNMSSEITPGKQESTGSRAFPHPVQSTIISRALMCYPSSSDQTSLDLSYPQLSRNWKHSLRHHLFDRPHQRTLRF
jgi:hypothetical protein